MRHPALLVLFLAAVTPAHARDARGAHAGYEDVVQVVADLTWHLRDDLYRFAPPRDPTGHDLFQLVLHRLESWETRFPGRLRDVTTFARAEALERLGEFARAAEAYRKVATMATPLAERAREGGRRADAFAAAAALPEDGPSIDVRLSAIRKKLEAWGPLIERHAGTPLGAVALVEEERLEQSAARIVVSNRHLLTDGTVAAERALRFLIEKHAESKQLADHVLRLGDFYAELAREYLEAHSRPLQFSREEFVRFVNRALDVYRKVATWDGAREKPEGEARFAALEAYRTATLARYN